MDVIILCGGKGTRLSEETITKPKPMVEIGGKPMLWHIMKVFSHQGFTDFIVALGYKGESIKEFFLNYKSFQSDLTINLESGKVDLHSNDDVDDWTVTLVDTGADVMTGGRIRRLRPFIGDDTFMMTYGDGIADIELGMLVDRKSVV